ncbi:MAG TPA: N-acetyl-alpha-D-glucosaminyl L-malate synthase BshA [Symbiobacteriaceae bacterium]
MRIGIVCYPSVGGSGIVATELAKQLAVRGHELHIISSDVPFRLNTFHENIFFHQVETPSYPLFKDPPYLLTLANKLVEVHRLVGLDIVHAHYAVPHATAAYLAREMVGPGGPKVVTTLHGTDITLMGADPSFTEIIAFSINKSDAVTAVSRSLRADTYKNLPVNREIDVMYNFLECSEWKRAETAQCCRRLTLPGEKVVAHMSNFRKVKRLEDVVQIFARINAATPARLLMIGDGPEVKPCCELVSRLGLKDRVLFMGNQESVVPLLSVSDLLLLPSEQESFGLAALEAMACGVPVVATEVGGLPEVVVDGETGFLCPLGDVEAMSRQSVRLLQDPEMHRQFSAASVHRVRQSFCAARVVPQYEELYRKVLGAS